MPRVAVCSSNMADSGGMDSANNRENTDANSGDRQNNAVATNSTEGEVEGAAPNQQQQQRQPTGMESFLSITKSLIVRGLVIYFITSFFRRPQPAVDPNAPPGSLKGPYPASNLFDNGSIYDLYFYVSEDFGEINLRDKNSAQFVHLRKGLVYGDWAGGPDGDGSERFKTQVKASEHVKNNGSLYLHVYATLQGNHPSEIDYTSHNWKQLNRFKKRRFTKTVNLLTGETAASPEDVKKAETTKFEIVSHWHPNMTVNIITDQTKWVLGSVPPPLDEYIQFLPGGSVYKPTLYFNEFWNMLRDYQPINDTTEVLDLDVTFQPLSLFRWQLYTALGMRNKWSNMLVEFGEEEDDEEQDSLKEVLSENSVYLLALTVIVSLLHSVFELLAFKNDIQFWNNRKSLEGLSVRSVFFNVFQSVVVLLYVLDNGTNTMVRISCFIGLLIEIWKIHKVLDIQIDRENKIGGLIPRISFKDKGSYKDSSTKEYDMLAFKYLSWALYPLLGGYAVYSLMYIEHRGWYSFVLNMLYGFLLTFGFIMMTPQLFINYKMKSVAHLPWRMLSYKFLNTFIDDIFAFVIKMPTMYRLGCFRDDIVFCIFLYQRYIYKTDPTRVNEFGFSAEMEEELAAKKESEKRGDAVAAIEDSPASQSSASKSPATSKSKSKHVAKDKVAKKKD